jgi:hypothetical protein
MKLTITEISVHSDKDSPIFGELTTKVRLDDMGAGIFISIMQDTDEGLSEVKLGFDEFEYLINAVNMLKQQEEVQ